MPWASTRCVGCELFALDETELDKLPVFITHLDGRLIWWSAFFPFDGTAADMVGHRWLEWHSPKASRRILAWFRGGCVGRCEVRCFYPGEKSRCRRFIFAAERLANVFWMVGLSVIPPVSNHANAWSFPDSDRISGVGSDS